MLTAERNRRSSVPRELNRRSAPKPAGSKHDLRSAIVTSTARCATRRFGTSGKTAQKCAWRRSDTVQPCSRDFWNWVSLNGTRSPPGSIVAPLNHESGTMHGRRAVMRCSSTARIGVLHAILNRMTQRCASDPENREMFSSFLGRVCCLILGQPRDASVVRSA